MAAGIAVAVVTNVVVRFMARCESLPAKGNQRVVDEGDPLVKRAPTFSEGEKGLEPSAVGFKGRGPTSAPLEWKGRWDSNPQPTASETGALPVELLPRTQCAARRVTPDG